MGNKKMGNKKMGNKKMKKSKLQSRDRKHEAQMKTLWGPNEVLRARAESSRVKPAKVDHKVYKKPSEIKDIERPHRSKGAIALDTLLNRRLSWEPKFKVIISSLPYDTLKNVPSIVRKMVDEELDDIVKGTEESIQYAAQVEKTRVPPAVISSDISLGVPFPRDPDHFTAVSVAAAGRTSNMSLKYIGEALLPGMSELAVQETEKRAPASKPVTDVDYKGFSIKELATKLIILLEKQTQQENV